MAFVNLPPNLQDMFYNITDRIAKLETGPNQAMYTAETAQVDSTQALTEAAAANALGVQALAEANVAIAQGTQAIVTANTALQQANAAYALGSQSLIKSANTITNSSNQLTAINGTGITVYSGASATTGARVVLNSSGLAGFNSGGTATFAIDATTGAVSTNGAIFTSSTITGGSLNIGGNAIINTSGYLTATGATITGNITATSGTFTGIVYASAGTFTGTITSSNATITGGSLTVGAYFQVNSLGQLTASSANITGAITATSGSFTGTVNASSGNIGGWLFDSAQIYNGGGAYISATSGNALFAELTATGSVLAYNGISTNAGAPIYSGGLITASGNLTAQSELYGVTAGSTTTTNVANTWISTGGLFRRYAPSSTRYKENIVNIVDVPELDPKQLLDLPVRAFMYKEDYLPNADDRYRQFIPGFISEEVDAIYPMAADYENGEIESWNDRMITAAMLSLIQDQEKRITILEGN